MKLGIFGGTFDPIHNAHLFLAESARQMEALDRVLFVPTSNQHYRDRPEVDPAHRCAMILGAIADNPAFVLETADLAPDATGFTVDLLPRLRAKYPSDGFTFIIGADSVVDSQWRRFDDVLEMLDKFVIAPRPGVREDALMRVISALPPRLRERISTLKLPDLTESATLIRSLCAQGRTVRYLVPDAVWQYIEAQHLYRASTHVNV
jgi:nicotinate-nucleotide adenylyltransferase